LALALLALLVTPAASLTQGSSYAVYTSDGRRSLPYRTSRNTDMVPLEQVANLFNLSVAEDSLVGGLVVRGRGQTVLLIPGQSFASVGPGRIVTLPAPVERDRGTWQVPVEFIRQVLAPTFNVKIELRRAERVILVGDVRLPQISGRFDRQGTGGRIVFEIQPAAPHRVTRQNNRVTVRFDAAALDFTPVTGLVKDLVTNIRVDGTSLVLELGPDAVTMRSSDVDATHLLIELGPAPPPPPPPVQQPALPTTPGGQPNLPAAPLPGLLAPQPGATGPGAIRTIVLDPGHGGDEKGVVGPGGTIEKDFVLQFAKRLESAIESRTGIRVLLTRSTDEAVPLDRRASVANNNKADLFISIHANSSRNASIAGAEVLSLERAAYAEATGPATPDLPVAFLGGGTRTIDILPWDLAQTGFTRRSSVVRTMLEAQLSRAGIKIFRGPSSELPLRPLVGASMPAVLVELGFLSNPAEEKELTQAARQQKTVDAVLALVEEIRRGIPEPPPATTP
jgi:N-acetylmuramoyl-L-alanine amidase